MVPAYVLLAIPLGYLILELRSWARMRSIAYTVLGALVLLNLFQTWQWDQGIISKERMTGAYYASIFGRVSVPDGASALLLVDRPLTEVETLSDESNYNMRILYQNEFDDRPDSVYTLTEQDPFTPGPDVRFSELTARDHAWLRISARLFVTDSMVASPVIVCTFHHKGETYKYKTAIWDLGTAPKNAWLVRSFDYITPEVRSPEDNVMVYIWNQHGGTQRVDDLSVEVFEPK
jgi:hypothetical protein